MICRTCREGADALTEALAPPTTTYPKLARELARQFHALCRGCDCQHKIDIQLNGATTATETTPTPPFTDQGN